MSLSPQRPYLHPGSSPPGWPAGSCGCATGSTWAQADREPPRPAIPPHSTVLSAHSPARIPERTCADSHAEGRGQTEKHARNSCIISIVVEEVYTSFVQVKVECKHTQNGP